MAWVTSFLYSLLAFIIILVPLVVFHEFGHFLFARLFGVKAEVFSVGFGPKIWSRQYGETEWRISAIPLGGYVKLLDQERDAELTDEERKRALHTQKAWKRFFIFFGGPLFNFIMAAFLFMVILVIGEPQVASVLGRVVHDSRAYHAGFRSGDRVVSVDATPVEKFDEMMAVVSKSPGRLLHFSVVHPNESQSVQISAEASSSEGLSMYGEPTMVGDLDGIMPMGRGLKVGVSDPSSPIGKAGIQTQDHLVSLNGKGLLNWEEWERRYDALSEGPMALEFEKSGTKEKVSVTITKSRKDQPDYEWGIHSSELFIDKVVAGSPAEQASLRPGDRLVAVGEDAVHSFFDLKDWVQRSGEKTGKVKLTWERAGKREESTLTPTMTEHRDVLLKKTTQFTVGIIPLLELSEPVTFIEQVWNPFKLVYRATDRMISFSWKNFVSLRKMLTGSVSVGTLGGPIMIGKIAGESLTRGVIAFLTNMAIFSIGLGVLNILPVPVLDGGHILLLGVESIRGKPLSMKQLEIIQTVGLLLVLSLMVIAFRNDISRLFYS